MITGRNCSGVTTTGRTCIGARDGWRASPEGSQAVGFLVIGADATGGYFSERLLETNHDVLFLIRPGPAARLADTGLWRSQARPAASPPP
jgi:hypothetical protein